MKQQDKELLIKDICARLPYGVKYDCMYGSYKGTQELTLIELYDIIDNDWIDGVNVYLRPMSSMTEEEYEQYRKFSYYGTAGYRNNEYKEMVATPSFEKMDFLNAHHFDYRGLIEKGLALEAPEGMYNIRV